MAERHTLVHRIADWSEQRGDRHALHGKDASGQWQHLTWLDYWQGVREIGKALIAQGLKPGECVAIVGDNRPEWVLCQFGIMAAGGIPAPIYTTNTVPQVAFILRHSQARIAICDGRAQLEKYLACRREEGVVASTIVTMDKVASDAPGVMSLDALRELGRKQPDTALDTLMAGLDPDKTALLIYTSGTTGTPKAVELTHDGMIRIADAIASLVEGLDAETYRVVSYLPLCHIAEQLFTGLYHLSMGGQVYFCPDLKLLKEYLVEVRPTVFLGVPRVWEKFEAALGTRFAEATGIKAKLLGWARKTELAAYQREVQTGKAVKSFGRRLAHKLVLSKLKGALGLDQLQVAVTGAAPIAVKTQEFFASLGIRVVEGYGMSETTGVATVSDIKYPVFGCVGKPLPGVELRLHGDGSEKEIQLRGPTMTRGYLRQPDETAELFSEDGWLRTGDVGEVTPDGLLRITGRMKDLIITAGGKNVAPAEIEGLLKSIPGVGQAVVLGDRQPYLTALLVLDAEGLPALCSRLGIETAAIGDVAANPKVREYFAAQIEERANPKLARYQKVQRFEVLPVEFTVDGGEMTPTMKVRRNIVNEKYRTVIDGLYTASAGMDVRARSAGEAGAADAA